MGVYVVVPAACTGLFSFTLGTDAIAEAMERIHDLKQNKSNVSPGRLFAHKPPQRNLSGIFIKQFNLIETATLRLATDTMPCLSAGWSQPLVPRALGVVAGGWGVGWIRALLTFSEGVTGRLTMLLCRRSASSCNLSDTHRVATCPNFDSVLKLDGSSQHAAHLEPELA